MGLRFGVNLSAKSFTDRDKPFSTLSEIMRVSLRLSAYLGSLVSLLARSDELGVYVEDSLVLKNLLSLSRLMWTSLPCTAALLPPSLPS